MGGRRCPSRMIGKEEFVMLVRWGWWRGEWRGCGVGRSLGIRLCRFPSQLIRFFLFVVTSNIGPEFNQFCAHGSFDGDGQATLDGAAHGSIIVRVVEVGKGRSDQISHDI